jgi:hypothetical protein
VPADGSQKLVIPESPSADAGPSPRSPREAFAYHGDTFGEATFIYADRTLRDFIAWTSGFQPDGHVYAPGMGHEPVRLTLVSNPQRRAA